MKNFFNLVNEYRPGKVYLENIMSVYCNKKSKIMLIGECQLKALRNYIIYRLQVSTLISSNKRQYLIWKCIKNFRANFFFLIYFLFYYIGILEQTLFWVPTSIGPNFQNFYFLPNTASLIPKKKTYTHFR